MIEGFVNADYEPVISILVQGSSGQEREIETVVDTGYNGYLSIAQLLVGPPPAIDQHECRHLLPLSHLPASHVLS